METGGSLIASESVRKLQTALHAKAKGSPDFRFYSLSDKVWRADVIDVAWQAVRRNGGAAGVDGETVQHIEQQGVERWLGELARDLKVGTYRPSAVRQVLIPKKQAGKVRPLGIPCIRDRVAQTAALAVLTPIFEADLEPEQYAYREGLRLRTEGFAFIVRQLRRLRPECLKPLPGSLMCFLAREVFTAVKLFLNLLTEGKNRTPIVALDLTNLDDPSLYPRDALLKLIKHILDSMAEDAHSSSICDHRRAGFRSS